VKPTTEFSPAPTQIPHEALTHDQSVPEFLQGISHELRTPLNVIIGMCQFLERDRKTPLSPIHRDAVDRMERNARTLLQSVNHLIEKLRNNNAHR
jgi:signal transduction histidine kinase